MLVAAGRMALPTPLLGNLVGRFGHLLLISPTLWSKSLSFALLMALIFSGPHRLAHQQTRSGVPLAAQSLVLRPTIVASSPPSPSALGLTLCRAATRPRKPVGCMRCTVRGLPCIPRIHGIGRCDRSLMPALLVCLMPRRVLMPRGIRLRCWTLAHALDSQPQRSQRPPVGSVATLPHSVASSHVAWSRSRWDQCQQRHRMCLTYCSPHCKIRVLRETRGTQLPCLAASVPARLASLRHCAPRFVRAVWQRVVWSRSRPPDKARYCKSRAA